jgi:hypothetical protein
MSPLELLALALANGKGIENFASGGAMYLVLDELAGSDGRMASLAIEDARSHSQDPLEQLNQAESALRHAWDKYQTAARPRSFFRKVGAWYTGEGPERSSNEALLSAVAAALTAAEVTRLAANPPMREEWLSRAKEDFDLYETRAKPEEPEMIGYVGHEDGYAMALVTYTRLEKEFESNVHSFWAAHDNQKRLPDLKPLPDL